MKKLLILLLVVAFWVYIESGIRKIGNWLDKHTPRESTAANSDFGVGQNPNKLPPNLLEKWKEIRDSVLFNAHHLRWTASNLDNLDSVRFEVAWGMEDGWECFDFVGKSEFGDPVEKEVVISPQGRSYTYRERLHGVDWADPGFDSAWDKHCVNKVPFVDATNMLK